MRMEPVQVAFSRVNKESIQCVEKNNNKIAKDQT